MSANDAALVASNVTKAFGKIVAVDDVSFEVTKGEIFGFLGPNGAGKTTTMRMLTGIMRPDSGRVTVGGIDMEKAPIQAKMGTGVIPEVGNVYADLTAKQNLSLTGRYYGLPKDVIRRRTEELLARVGLSERGDDLVRTFSKGMKQRISIACAIIHKPGILFLDEPTEGLDVQSKRLIVDTIHDMNRNGSTIFLTTHNIEDASKLCQRVAIINKGRLIAIDRPEMLKKTFDKSQSIEVSFDRMVDALTLAHGSISKIEVLGDRLRLYTSDPDGTIKHVAAWAQGSGARIVSMTMSGPSLEDAFVQLTGGGK